MSAFRAFADNAARRTLSPPEMREAMTVLLEGGVAADEEIADFLMALRNRGETIDEIVAAAKVMREKAELAVAPAEAIDTCGTGGDGVGTFNISTAAALVAAGAGAYVAKHGNNAASSKSGSAEVLRELGVKIDASPTTMGECLQKARVGFFYARKYHRAVANVAKVRAKLGVRTIFNLLGPLCNPAGAPRQLMGVYSRELVLRMARVLDRLGSHAAWVVHGSDGLDELTTTGPSFVAELRNGRVREFAVKPQDVGLKLATINDLKGGTPAENAVAIRRLLEGEKGPHRDIVVLNAAAALVVAGKAATLIEGAALADESIAFGRAKEALEKLIEVSNLPHFE
ncbi:MAG: anthranilate phosphoribosyltransferase [Amphiplicatus sp.]